MLFYNKILKDGYIPTEFKLNPLHENEDIFVLKFVAYTSNTERVELEIARHEDYNILIDVSE
ncbi:MAG: hypothetical protein ACRCX8_18545 [Sarcina sp.]